MEKEKETKPLETHISPNRKWCINVIESERWDKDDYNYADDVGFTKYTLCQYDEKTAKQTFVAAFEYSWRFTWQVGGSDSQVGGVQFSKWEGPAIVFGLDLEKMSIDEIKEKIYELNKKGSCTKDS